jgi:3-dehydroquinate dehydratase/shikimate dehydrogenase
MRSLLRHCLAGFRIVNPDADKNSSSMNKGKICVSVCAETADELIEQIKRAKDLADVIEIRFDCLKKEVFENFDYNFPYKKNYIFTFRPKEQGGKRELSLREREVFWNSGNDFCGGDFEEDVVKNHLDWLYSPVICSYHDFEGVPNNLIEIYERIKFSESNADIIKIAVQTDDITDTISIWKLLEKATAENQQIIPIAMGEAGKWTRILGLAHGAFMTYASLDAGNETAPGQISVKDLIEVYRVKELNEETEVYGILGSNTSVSMSPYIHNEAFKFHNLNSVFVPLQVSGLDEFICRMVKLETREIELNFRGFSVTIPHKQAIIKHLDFIDETAQAIGAVNTVKIENGKLYGYNTDAQGFIEPLKNSYGDLRDAKVAILGNGGAARACTYALKKEGAEVVIFARNPKKAESLANEFQVELKELAKTEDQSPKTNFNEFDILVNTTPLGMKGRFENETPLVAGQIENVKLVYDLVYNPFETRFLKEAKSVGIPTIGGLAMLISQAMWQSKIWTGLDAPMKEMSQAALRKLRP